MQTKKYIKALCIMLVFIFFIFDVCLSESQIDTLFVRQKQGAIFNDYSLDVKENPTILMGNLGVGQAVSCTTTLSQKGVFERSVNTSTIYFLSVALFLLLFVKKYAVHHTTQEIVIPANMVLINYIHQKDGKKSRLL